MSSRRPNKFPPKSIPRSTHRQSRQRDESDKISKINTTEFTTTFFACSAFLLAPPATELKIDAHHQRHKVKAKTSRFLHPTPPEKQSSSRLLIKAQPSILPSTFQNLLTETWTPLGQHACAWICRSQAESLQTLCSPKYDSSNPVDDLLLFRLILRERLYQDLFQLLMA